MESGEEVRQAEQSAVGTKQIRHARSGGAGTVKGQARVPTHLQVRGGSTPGVNRLLGIGRIDQQHGAGDEIASGQFEDAS